LILGILRGRGLEVDDDQAAVGVPLDEVGGAHQVPVDDGAGGLIDERHGEGPSARR
jgi:hypothetical protein